MKPDEIKEVGCRILDAYSAKDESRIAEGQFMLAIGFCVNVGRIADALEAIAANTEPQKHSSDRSPIGGSGIPA